MDPSTIGAVLSALGAGLILREIVKWLLNRPKLKFDQAHQLREELSTQIALKNKEIAEIKLENKTKIDTLDRRIDVLESELEKAESDRSAVQIAFGKYKLDVYRALMEAGVDRELLNTVLAIQ